MLEARYRGMKGKCSLESALVNYCRQRTTTPLLLHLLLYSSCWQIMMPCTNPKTSLDRYQHQPAPGIPLLPIPLCDTAPLGTLPKAPPPGGITGPPFETWIALPIAKRWSSSS
jgi:hypothetical protein